MGGRVKVTDPYSGVTIEVNEGSPQAIAWGATSPHKVKSEPGKKPVRGRKPVTKKD